MAKMVKGTFMSKGANGEVQRSGYLFDLLLADNTVKKMGVYKLPDTWWVIDIDTGLGLCNGPTRKDAVARAESEPMVKKFTDLVNSPKYAHMRNGGEPPRAPKPEVADPKAVRAALLDRATDQAANDPDGKVKGGNLSRRDGDMLWRLEKADRLGKSSWGNFTNWYLDGEFICCIERRFSKRKIHLCYPELKPFVHFEEHKGEKLAEEMKKRVEEQAKANAGADVKAKAVKVADGITAITIEQEKEGDDMEKRIAELEAELKAAHKELEEVWKENAALKAKPDAPKAEGKPEDTAAAVSLEAMREWCKERGNMAATQKHEGCPIWVEGETKPYMDELNGMGFRWSPKRKGWYIKVA